MKKPRIKKEYVYYYERYKIKEWLLFKRKRNRMVYVFEVLRYSNEHKTWNVPLDYKDMPLIRNFTKFAIEWQYITEVGPYLTWKVLYGKEKEENSNI